MSDSNVELMPAAALNEQGTVTIQAKEYTNLVHLAQSSMRLTDEQITGLKAKTPKPIIKKVQKRGGTYNYVPHGYITKRLNEVFRHVWSWEIMKYDIFWEHDQIVLHGRLRVMLANGLVITKDAVGGAEVKRYGEKHKNAGKVMDVADDIKGASSDAKKKAASELGIALDVYAPVLDEIGISDVDISEAELAGITEYVDKLKEKQTEEEVNEYIKDFAKLALTDTQIEYLQNEAIMAIKNVRRSAFLEQVYARLRAVKTKAEYDLEVAAINTGKYGRLTPDDTKLVMNVAAEVKASLPNETNG